MESIVKNFSKQKVPVPDEFTGKFYQKFKEIKTKGGFPNSFNEVSITLIPNQRNIIRKENYKPLSLKNTDAKIFKKISAY